MTTKRLKPAREGLKVPMPEGRGFLPAEGAEVELSSWWVRRLAQLEVVEVVEDQPATKAPKAAKPQEI